MWSEQVEGVAVEAKLWPRVAALGERLWADPESGNTKHWECHPDFLGVLKLSNFHRMLLEREGAVADEEFERIQKNWPRDQHKKWVNLFIRQ